MTKEERVERYKAFCIEFEFPKPRTLTEYLREFFLGQMIDSYFPRLEIPERKITNDADKKEIE